MPMLVTDCRPWILYKLNELSVTRLQADVHVRLCNTMCGHGSCWLPSGIIHHINLIMWRCRCLHATYVTKHLSDELYEEIQQKLLIGWIQPQTLFGFSSLMWKVCLQRLQANSELALADSTDIDHTSGLQTAIRGWALNAHNKIQ